MAFQVLEHIVEVHAVVPGPGARVAVKVEDDGVTARELGLEPGAATKHWSFKIEIRIK